MVGKPMTGSNYRLVVFLTAINLLTGGTPAFSIGATKNSEPELSPQTEDRLFLPILLNSSFTPIWPSNFDMYYPDDRGKQLGYRGLLNTDTIPGFGTAVNIKVFNYSTWLTDVIGIPAFYATLPGQPNPISGIVGQYPYAETYKLNFEVSLLTYTLISTYTYVDIGNTLIFSPPISISSDKALTRTVFIKNTQPVTLTSIKTVFYTSCYPFKILEYPDGIRPNEVISFTAPDCFIPDFKPAWSSEMYAAQAQIEP